MTGKSSIIVEMVDCPKCEGFGKLSRYIKRTEKLEHFKCIICDGSGKLLMGRTPFHAEKSNRYRRSNRRTPAD